MRNVIVKKRSPEAPATTPLMKNSSFLTGHFFALQRKKQGTSTWADLFCRFFEFALPLSPDQWARTHRHSERTCVREWSSDGRTSSSFFSVNVNVLPTKAITHTKKNFSRDFSSDTCPWIRHDESLSCSSAPIKATDQAIETGGTVIHFEERCTAKNNFETNKFTRSPSVSIILLFASSNLSLPLRLSRTVLVHANLSRGTHFLWIFFFFLARGWNQCVRWTRNTNKKRRALIAWQCTFKVARDSCDVTHSLKQASIHTSHFHASKSFTKYSLQVSLHLVQSTSTH